MLHAYNYAYVRVVPRIEIGEFLNVGVILFCRTKRFLDVRIALPHERLTRMAPYLSPQTIQAHLDLIPQICHGDGPIGQLELAERFRWIVAPHDTIIQCGPAHTGLCDDPLATLERLHAALSL
ncbi:MAG: DUF3037 domain-containing protein [Caldilineaceae bacterium]|nr:DUF3037 domain-containing protein [Caldilineaceae bacterium]